jgi:hypothetical protein
MDTIRVLRILEYVGPRDAVEAVIDRSIHGSRTYGLPGREVTITAATLGTFPEILERKPSALLTAAQGLGAMPEGYCFCSKDRVGDDSKIHEPECAGLRLAICGAENEARNHA